MDNSGRMYILEATLKKEIGWKFSNLKVKVAYQDLVQKVLDELLL